MSGHSRETVTPTQRAGYGLLRKSTPLPPRAPVLCAYPHRNIFRNFMKGASYA
jgi:hypothetical protein